MDKAVITPTFGGHFRFVDRYLESFDAYLLDRDMPLYFIVDRAEGDAFTRLTCSYKRKLDVRTVILEDVFDRFGVRETPAEALAKYGRLSFQTLKKFYGGMYVGAEKFLFLDSESMLVAPTSLSELFDTYFTHPKFFLSRVADKPPTYKDGFTYGFLKALEPIFGEVPPYWTIESYEWFYELRILRDLVEKLGQPIDLVRAYRMPGHFPNVEGILEALLYYEYIYYYNDRYHYETHIIEDELKEYLGEKECARFFKHFYRHNVFSNCGVLECFMFFVDGFSRMLRDRCMKTLRVEFPISTANARAQRRVVRTADLRLMPSSQSHFFGINHRDYVRTFVTYSPVWHKLKVAWHVICAPLPAILEWLGSVLKLVKYSFRALRTFLFYR